MAWAMGNEACSSSRSELSTTTSRSTGSPHALVQRRSEGGVVNAKAIRLHGKALASEIT
jgi:hypothetical protein